MGPNELPSPNSNSSSKGIGPIEFIRTTPLTKGLLLAGSLDGGLFYSSDGGNNWLNTGSDNWNYSTATWADFYPENSDVWFATNHRGSGSKGNSWISNSGGIYRTLNRGVNWEQIADFKSFNNNSYTVIYKTVFNPENPKILYVVTSIGLFYTDNCLAKDVIWKQDKSVEGLIYDLTFLGKTRVISYQSKGKWKLMVGNSDSKRFTTDLSPNIIRYTLACDSELTQSLYVLIDYKSGSDKIFKYNINDDSFLLISRSQKVAFGQGRAFAINPYDSNEIYVGVSVRLRRWNINKSKFENLNSNYHVDVEFVTFDPFDENIVYMANHGGIYISYDKGKSWKNKSDGLSVAMVYGMDVSETNPNQIVIGTYHDGSSVYADWDENGSFKWKNVNGGDALIPFIDPENPAIIYTSNQYSGGGIYYSNDTAKTNSNIHSKNRLKTSGWEMAANLHPMQSNVLYFNSNNITKESKGNEDVYRTTDANERKNANQISDFKTFNDIENYSVYGLFTSEYHPDILLAYVFSFEKDEKGNNITKHRVFRTLNALDSVKNVLRSWVELEIPRQEWIGSIVVDKSNYNKIYYSYFGGTYNTENIEETGVIFLTKYRWWNTKLKRSDDISDGIKDGKIGKYNLIYKNNNDELLLIGTREGVFMRKKNFFGWKPWQKIGFALPHCEIYGLHYNESKQMITVGLNGRGVWRISIESID